MSDAAAAQAMQVSVTHDEVAQLLRRLHAAEVDLVLCTRTGPGWIVSYRTPAAPAAGPAL